MWRNPYPSSRGSEFGNYPGNEPWENKKNPSDMSSNRNYSALDNSNNNNPAGYNSNNNPINYDTNNRNPPYYNSNNNPANYNSNNNSPVNYDSNNRSLPFYYSNNNNPADYYSNNNHPINYDTNDRNSPYFNTNNNNPINYGTNNKNPPYYNSNNNNPADYNSNNNSPINYDPNNKNPPYYNSNNNNPVNYNSNNNNPINYDSSNRSPSYYNSNNNNPVDYNSNNNNPVDYNSNNNSPINYDSSNRSPYYYNSNNNNPVDYSANNNNPVDYNAYNNNPVDYNANNNNPVDYNANNNNPVNYNSNNNNRADYNSNNNNRADYNSNNNNPVNYDSNIRSPLYYNTNNTNPANYNSNINKPADYNSNNNNPSYYHSIRRPSPYDSDDNHSTYFNQNNNRSPYSNSNNSYPANLSTNNSRNVPIERSERWRDRHRNQRNFPNNGYSDNDSKEGQYVPHSSNFEPKNYNPNNNEAPNNYNNEAPSTNNRDKNSASNDEQKSPFYIYYQPDPLKGGRIVCLFTAAKFLKSGFTPTMVPARLCTVVNYEFATLNSTTYEISPGHPDLDYGQNFYNKTVGLKNLNPHLKVMLSLGGWRDSTKKYSDLVASTRKVNNFITKAVKFLTDHNFDGLDVAWEYPNCWQGACGVSPQDKPNYAKFLKKLRTAFDRRNLLLSISVSSLQREIKQAYDGPTIAKAVHFINVMTYDMHGPWEKKTGHHSKFDKTANDSETEKSLNSKATMEFWASIGVPKIKLNMGIATYATTFTLKNSTNHGLGAPTKGPGKAGALSHNAGTLYYREICQYLDAGNWTEVENYDIGFYAYSGDQWAGYDHPRMVVKKTKWISDNGYGGLLIKDVSGDDYEQKCFAKKFPLIWIAGMEFTLRRKGKQ